MQSVAANVPRYAVALLRRFFVLVSTIFTNTNMKNTSFFRLLCAVFITTLFWQNSAVAQVAYAVGSEDKTTLTFYYDNDSESRAGKVYAFPQGKYDKPNWNSNFTTVVFDNSFKDARPTSCYYWFGEFKNLTRIEGLENLNTSEVTDMGYMFYYCTELTEIDLSGFNTEKVTDMGEMFMGCHNLTNLELSGFNTENVTSLYGMFWECYKIKTLDLSSFNTLKINSTNYMFSRCSNLRTIFVDQEKWVLHNVEALVSGYDPEGMFRGCFNLFGEKGMGYDNEKTTAKFAHIDNGPSNPGYFTAKGNTPFKPKDEAYGIVEDGVLTLRFGDEVPEKACVITNCDGALKNPFGDFNKVVFDKSFASIKPTCLSLWFSECSNLSTIEGLENLNTSAVTDMSSMFNKCSKLTKLDLSNFDTHNVTDISSMFRECSSLTTIDLSSFDTQNVTKMGQLFYNCSSLTSIDLSSFDTHNVTDMSSMFMECSSLTTLNLSAFDTHKVTKMIQMFKRCNNLTTIFVGDYWDASQVTTNLYLNGQPVENMFIECTAIKGGNGTIYDEDKIGFSYAKIDKEGQPGYLTYKKPHAVALIKNITIPYKSIAQPLITFNVTNLGKPLYSLDGITYSETIPQGSNIGEYTVYFKVEDDEKYYGIEPTTIKVTITKGQSHITKDPVAVEGLVYKGYPQILIVHGESDLGSILYKVGENGKYSAELPRATDAGEYTIYYKIQDTDNYFGIEEKSLNVTIGVSTPIIETPKHADNIKVWSSNKTIYITAPADTKYTIIDLNGRTIKTSTAQSTKEEISIAKSGIYIVIINGESYKVSVN